MANYVLDMKKPHRQSLLELVNHDNAATIRTPLTLADVVIKGERAVDKVGEGIERDYAVTLERADYAKDTVEVFFNKVNVNDVMTMTAAEGDFNWYDPDTWVEETSPAEAITAFKAAAVRAGIDPETAMEEIAVSREFVQEENHFFLTFTFKSCVFASGVKFRMPKHFSEVIKVRELAGFIYSPITAEQVVD